MYHKRLIEIELERKLQTSGAVLVAGPKFCGKTTTCMQFQRSFIKLNTMQAISLARINPKEVLTGETPRLIDEWQKAPDIWNQVKDNLDYQYEFGKFILTGNSTPADKTTVHHSGAGRIIPLNMRPMSLWESNESKGTVSLKQLFDANRVIPFDMENGSSLQTVAHQLCRGGWPIAVLAPQDIAIEITRNYWNSLFIFEDCENERFRNKKPETLKMIVKSYARHISGDTTLSTIMADVCQNNERNIDKKTFDSYLEALQDIFIVEDMPAWNPNIRSKTSIRSTPTRHFVDTSIACMALGVSPQDLLDDLETFGLFFEDMAVRDLRVYASCLGGNVLHYHDNSGLECDAIVHLDNGSWGAIEIKLGGDDLIEAGAQSLLRLKSKIEEKSSEKSPSFLMVLTAVGPTYQRPDGVIVTSLSCLKN